MDISLVMVTTDSTDPKPLAEWWAEQLGAAITQDFDGFFQIVEGGSLPVRLAFQKVDEVAPGKNRIHLDLDSADPEADVEGLVAAGAALVGWRGEEGFRWATLTDPQGNEFCIGSNEH